MSQENLVDIVIPSFNGRYLLEKHLPAVIKASPEVSRIIIVDDKSVDDTELYLEANFSNIKIIRNPHNLGFTKSVNRGVKESDSDFIVLLNNDVVPHPGYLTSALKYFSDKSIFAVTFNENQSSWPQVYWDQGKIGFVRGEDKKLPHLSAWASGGSAIFRRNVWDKLGGFNEIYSPGYWEDIDLGWRAWKSGYKIVWDPSSVVDHQHESSFGKLNRSYISLVRERNELLFHWQNITDKEYRTSHYAFLIRYTLTHPGYLKVILAASRKLPLDKHPGSVLSDSQILNLVNNVYRS